MRTSVLTILVVGLVCSCKRPPTPAPGPVADSQTDILIVTERTAFKQAVVDRVTERLTAAHRTFRVVDLKALEADCPKDHKAVVILWDEAGRRISGADALLTNPRWGLPTERWSPGAEEVNYYIVPVPLGTPPLSYRITVGVYDAATMERLPVLDADGNPTGDDFPLGEVVLSKARDFERDPYGTRAHLSLKTVSEPEIADGLALEMLYSALAPVEASLDRRISPTLYTGREFDTRRAAGHPFLARVLEGERLLLIGNEGDPAGTRQPGADRPAQAGAGPAVRDQRPAPVGRKSSRRR